MNEIAADRLKLMAQSNALAAPIMGEGEVLVQNAHHIYGSVGSGAAGAFFSKRLGDFSVRGGVAWQHAGFGDVKINEQLMVGGSLNYAFTAFSGLRPLVEVGGWTTTSARFTFDRTYANGAGTAEGVGTTHGQDSYAFVLAGLAFSPTHADAANVSIEFGRARLETSAYDEVLSKTNPFEAHAGHATDHFTALKLGGAWEHHCNDRFDLGGYVRGAWSDDYRSDYAAFVPGFDVVAPERDRHATWIEYGAHAGLRVSDHATASLFVDGVTGGSRIGSDAHVGVDLAFTY